MRFASTGKSLKHEVEKKNDTEPVPAVRTLLGFNKPVKKDDEFEVGPAVLFDGSRMLMFKIFEKDIKLESVSVQAQAPDGPLSVKVPINQDCYLNGGKFLHQLAARRKIQDIEENLTLSFNHSVQAVDCK